MGLTGNSAPALPFSGSVMWDVIEQDLLHSPLFLYPALSFTCCFCGGGAAIWSKLFSNVKYQCVGVRYLTNPRTNQHWKHSSLSPFVLSLVVPQGCPALSALGLCSPVLSLAHTVVCSLEKLFSWNMTQVARTDWSGGPASTFTSGSCFIRSGNYPVWTEELRHEAERSECYAVH